MSDLRSPSPAALRPPQPSGPRGRSLTPGFRKRCRTISAASTCSPDEDFLKEIDELGEGDAKMLHDMLTLMSGSLPAVAELPTLNFNEFDNLFLEYCAFHVSANKAGTALVAPQNPAKAVRQKNARLANLDLESLDQKAAAAARAVPEERIDMTAECLRTLASHVRQAYDPEESFVVMAETVVNEILIEHNVRGEDLEGMFEVLIERKNLINEMSFSPERAGTSSARPIRDTMFGGPESPEGSFKATGDQSFNNLSNKPMSVEDEYTRGLLGDLVGV